MSDAKFTMPDLNVSTQAKARQEKQAKNRKYIEEMKAGLPVANAPLGQVARAMVVYVVKDILDEPYDTLHMFLRDSLFLFRRALHRDDVATLLTEYGPDPDFTT